MKYLIDYTDEAEIDILKLQKSGDKKTFKKLHLLIAELKEHPKTGTGKPEQLKYYKIPTWSRHISDKHRLIYQIYENTVTVLIVAAFGHYEDN